MSDERPESNGGVTVEKGQPFGLPRWVLALLPVVLLAIVLGLFLVGNPFAALGTGGEPLPDVTISYTTLPDQGTILVHVTNNGPDAVTLSQVLVNDAYWNFGVSGGDRTLGPLESATVEIPYRWNPGWDLDVTLVLSDGATVSHTIVAPSTSPGVTGTILETLAVVGLFVGIIPVALGILWFPYLRSLSEHWLHAVIVFAAGVLAFLAFDATFDAFELLERVPGAFEGSLLFVLGVFGAFFTVQAISSWREQKAAAGSELASSGLWVAYLVAISIGLHNLAEGLAIGSAFALGRVALGTFLVIGFMIHNVTEGPAIVGPVAQGERPALKHFVAFGVLAGGPVIPGAWIGSFAFSPTLGTFFLAIGVGAILQVVWELAKMARGESGRAATPLNLGAFLVGFVFMYVTGLFVTV
jgi:zinc transporter ZupT